jgi:hypothetical protein
MDFARTHVARLLHPRKRAMSRERAHSLRTSGRTFLRTSGLRSIALCALAALAALGTLQAVSIQPARASVVQALTLPDLVSQATHIVVALPQERQSRATGRLLLTDVSLRVLESLKGGVKQGDTLVATLLGGAVDGIGLQVPGEASLPEGRKVLVFLQPSKKSGDLRVVGMAQGVLPIEERQGTDFVKPSAGHAELMQRGPSGALKPGAAAVTSEVALPDLLTRIRGLVK